jgi:hypothetical protein
VADGQVPLQAGQGPVVEDAGHEALVLDHGELLAVADRHAGGLLAAVLEREQAEVGQLGRGEAGGVHGEDPARLPQVVVVAVVGPRGPDHDGDPGCSASITAHSLPSRHP